MASGAIYSAIRTYLEAQWTTTPLVFENEGQQPGGESPPAWVLVELAGDAYEQVSIGAATVAANRWDEDGSLYLSVMVPSGSGSLVARTHARNLADLFRGQTLMSGTLEFGAAHFGLGRTSDTDGNWYVFPVDIDWRKVE